MIEVKIKKLHENAVIPFYATDGSAGMDITCVDYHYDKDTDCWIYNTGLAFELPKGYVMLIFPRSSNYKTDFYLTNHVGVLDSDYRGEMKFIFKYRDKGFLPPKGPYSKGDRIGQIMIIPYPKIKFDEVDNLEETERGSGGFGSTGK